MKIKKLLFSTTLFVVMITHTTSRIVHLSFHKGCITDFNEVAQALNLDVTSVYLHEHERFKGINFDGVTTGNGRYNITHEYAERVWNLHKDYFDQFDAVVVSDTAPLSRIFLQNGWEKKLIIWVCNRFDYFDQGSSNGWRPDQEYYNLFQKAVFQKNVKIISYTSYEHFYGAQKGVIWGDLTIRPLGNLEREVETSAIPSAINRSSTLFLYPRLEKNHVSYIQHECANLGINTYFGSYNGPDDLKGFKGILYFPYAWSNLALFENIQRGYIHFVPSERFVLNHWNNIRTFTGINFELCDWYCPENRDLFVYFDSWQELKEKVQTTNYALLSEKIKNRARTHRDDMLNRWTKVFNDLELAISL